MLRHEAFTHDGFAEKYLLELRHKVCSEFQGNPLLRKHQSAAVLTSCKQQDVPSVQLQIQQQLEQEEQESTEIEDHPQHK